MKTPRFLLAACILLALALTFSCSDDDSDFLAKLPPEPEYCIDFVDGTKREHFGKEKEQFCDKRDGNLYVKVTIGTQTWMAEDLNYMMYNSQCYSGPQYNEEGEEIGCETSRLYDWRGARGACPIGWRLPTIDDWNTLVNYVGASESAIKLKATSGWRDYNDHTYGNGTDDYGLALLPGGWALENSRGDGQLFFYGNKTEGRWWSSSESETNINNAVGFSIDHVSGYPMFPPADKSRTYTSIRCVKD